MKKSKQKQEYRMPDGSFTTNGNKMAKAWRAFSKPFEQATGCGVIGYDPGVLFTTSLKFGGQPFNIPVQVLQKLNEKLKQ